MYEMMGGSSCIHKAEAGTPSSVITAGAYCTTNSHATFPSYGTPPGTVTTGAISAKYQKEDQHHLSILTHT